MAVARIMARRLCLLSNRLLRPKYFGTRGMPGIGKIEPHGALPASFCITAAAAAGALERTRVFGARTGGTPRGIAARGPIKGTRGLPTRAGPSVAVGGKVRADGEPAATGTRMSVQGPGWHVPEPKAGVSPREALLVPAAGMKFVQARPRPRPRPAGLSPPPPRPRPRPPPPGGASPPVT
jgi:hypothetical protein